VINSYLLINAHINTLIYLFDIGALIRSDLDQDKLMEQLCAKELRHLKINAGK